jgi:hypothetical protein
MIEYVEITSAPPMVVADLPRFNTVNELENYLYNVKADIISINQQLATYKEFGMWPHRNKEWKNEFHWLQVTLIARDLRTWTRTIVEATLDKLEGDRLTELENKILQMDAYLSQNISVIEAVASNKINEKEKRISKLESKILELEVSESTIDNNRLTELETKVLQLDACLSREIVYIQSRLGKGKKSKAKGIQQREEESLPSMIELIERFNQLNEDSQSPNEDVKRIYRILYENGLLPSYLSFIKEDIEKNLDTWGL